MTEADRMIIIGIAAVVVIYIFYRIGKPSEPKDRPGPHNNWRSDKTTINSSSWTEDGHGDYGSGDGGSH